MSISLRSRRGPIGVSGPAVALREQIEAQLPAARATTGRRAARAGRVQWLDVAPGAARAEVTDDLTGHGVIARLDVRPLPPGDREALLRIAHAHPELPARLVAGQLPEDVAHELEAEEIALVPRGPADLTHDCSCHDWPGPCTHVAALGYVLVEAVDAEPTTLLTLRGLTLEELAAPLPPLTPGGLERGPAAGEVVPEERAAPVEPPEDQPDPPRFDPSRAVAQLLVEELGAEAAGVLARFYGAQEPGPRPAP